MDQNLLAVIAIAIVVVYALWMVVRAIRT